MESDHNVQVWTAAIDRLNLLICHVLLIGDTVHIYRMLELCDYTRIKQDNGSEEEILRRNLFDYAALWVTNIIFALLWI